MASATISSSSTTKSRIRPAAVSERGFGEPSALGFAVLRRGIGRFAGVPGERRASRRNQGAKFSFVGFGECLGKQVREALCRTLRQGAEHLRIQIPILALVLGSENAALGGALEALFEILRVDAPEELLECGAHGRQRRDALGLQFA